MSTATELMHPAQGAPSADGKSQNGVLQKAASALGTLLAVLLVMVAAAVMVFAIATRFAANDQYTAFGHPTLAVLSGSMTPVIDTGDLIIDNRVTSGEANHLRVGQIITFFDAPGSKMVLTHRIVRVVASEQ